MDAGALGQLVVNEEDGRVGIRKELLPDLGKPEHGSRRQGDQGGEDRPAHFQGAAQKRAVSPVWKTAVGDGFRAAAPLEKIVAQ